MLAVGNEPRVKSGMEIDRKDAYEILFVSQKLQMW
jgi:hypothetical protein